jgi:hypothetical protein
MIPYLAAHDLWSSHTPSPWYDLLDLAAQTGVLVSSPDVFLAAVPSTLENAGEYLSPLQYPEEAECWYIWCAAGNAAHLRTLSSLAPYSLPWVIWHHKGRQKKIRWKSLLHHESSKNSDPRSSSSTAAASFLNGRGETKCPG